MLDSKKILLVIFVISFSQFCFGQNQSKKTWGISIIPGFSKTKTIGYHGYPPPPFLIDLKISEPWQFVTHAETFLTKKRGQYSLTKAIGLSGYNYYDQWEYDPASTATNYVWGKRSFVFAYFAFKVSREFQVGEVLLIPEVGISYDYLVKAKYDSESKIGSIHQNLLPQLDRNNFGICASVKVKIKLNDKFGIRTGPYFKQLIKEYSFAGDVRKFYFLGLSLDLIRAFN